MNAEKIIHTLRDAIPWENEGEDTRKAFEAIMQLANQPKWNIEEIEGIVFKIWDEARKTDDNGNFYHDIRNLWKIRKISLLRAKT